MSLRLQHSRFCLSCGYLPLGKHLPLGLPPGAAGKIIRQSGGRIPAQATEPPS